MSESSPECRRQRAVDLELRELFREAEIPRLSDRFQHALRERIAVERQFHSRRRFSSMHAYWLVAGVVSILILLYTDLPGLSGPGTWIVGVLVPVLCFLTPIALLSLRLKLGLFELIVSTMHIPDRSLH